MNTPKEKTELEVQAAKHALHVAGLILERDRALSDLKNQRELSNYLMSELERKSLELASCILNNK